MIEYPTKGLKFVGYIRKSTDNDRLQKVSISSQLEWMEKYCEEKNIELLEVFIEKQSAKRPGRPEFNKMAQMIEEGHINGIVTWLPDRLSRNSVDTGTLVYLMDLEKLKIICTSQMMFTGKTMEKYMFLNFSNNAKLTNDLKTDDTIEKMTAAISKGKWMNAAPMGYLWDRGSLLLDQTCSKQIQSFLMRYSTGNYSVKDLREKMRLEWDPNNKKKLPSKTALYYLLANRFYYGGMVWRGKEYEGNHPILISKKIYEKNQKIRASREGSTTGRRKHFFTYSGLFTCGECGSKYTAEVQKGIKYYRCQKKKPCSQPYLREDIIEDQIFDFLDVVTIPPVISKLFIEKYRRDADITFKVSREIVRTKQEELEKLNQKKKRLLDVYIDGGIDKDIYRDAKDEIERKVDRLNLEIKERSDFKEDVFDKTEEMFELLKFGCSKGKTAEYRQKGEIVKLLCSNFTILDKKIVDYRERPILKEYMDLSKLMKVQSGTPGRNRTYGQ